MLILYLQLTDALTVLLFRKSFVVSTIRKFRSVNAVRKMIANRCWVFRILHVYGLLLVLLVSSLSSTTSAFTTTIRPSTIKINNRNNGIIKGKHLNLVHCDSFSSSSMATISTNGCQTSTRLQMAFGNDGEGNGPGPLASFGILLVMLLFVGSGLLPILDGGGQDLSIADSVVTTTSTSRQQERSSTNADANNNDRLSRSTIQGKLSSIPVFYVANSDGKMETDIYFSYAEASAAASGSSSVKVTSLDQVM